MRKKKRNRKQTVEERWAFVREHLREKARGHKRVALGFSGGCDSLFLLMLAHEVLQERLLALHIDHGLRKESQMEQEQCGLFCQRFGIAFAGERLHWTQSPPKSNIQAKAREKRLVALEDLCVRHEASLLLVAHHDDDQLETFFLRLARGSGVDGLSGMPQERLLPSGVTLFRPLLTSEPLPFGESKQQIRRWLASHNLLDQVLEDPSNNNEQFARASMRLRLLPELQAFVPSWAVGCALENLARASQALEHWTNQIWETQVTAKGEELRMPLDALKKLPEEMRLRVLSRLLQCVHRKTPYRPRLSSLKQALFQILSGKKCTLMHCVLTPTSGILSVTPERF